MSNTFEQVSKITIRLILDEPFYGHFFTGILKEISSKTETLCIGLAETQMVKLYINPTFWETVLNSTDYRYGAIKHEILHVVLKHILLIHKYTHKDIFNIAADIVVNQYIAPHQLVEGVILLSQFEDLDLEPNQDVGYYYDKLLAAWTNYLNQLGTDSEVPKTRSITLLDHFINQPNPHISEHDLWLSEVSRMSQAARDILEVTLDTIIESTYHRIGQKSIGNLPAGLKGYLEALLLSKKPRLNWRRVLRLFTCSSSRTQIKNTIRRPSKRYGTTPGIQVRRKQKILIAVDTSGSIQQEELKEFFGELYHIWRQGAEIFVVECDVTIHRKYIYKGKPPEFVMGRGGTTFDAPLHFANEEYQPDAIVYFTDGYAAVPQVKNRKPILWMISSTGLNVGEGHWHQLPGRVVKM